MKLCGPGEELSVEATDGKCQIRGEASEFDLATEDPTHFPEVPGFGADRYHEIQAGTLLELTKRMLFAVATDSHRYAMAGALWELDGKNATLVGTDGRRLAIA
jgi:DNA polymerase-3 subunit beta